MKIVHNDVEYRVLFKHNNDKKNKKIEHKSTECSITDNVGNVFCTGIARVNPKDNYCKSTGRHLSLKRATSRDCGIPGEVIKQIWENYSERKK